MQDLKMQYLVLTVSNVVHTCEVVLNTRVQVD